MDVTEIRPHLDEHCEFPLDRAGLIDAVGDQTVTAANGGSTRLVEAIETTDERTYDTATEAHETILANLGEGFVGRKYYDDRGGASADRHRTQSL